MLSLFMLTNCCMFVSKSCTAISFKSLWSFWKLSTSRAKHKHTLSTDLLSCNIKISWLTVLQHKIFLLLKYVFKNIFIWCVWLILTHHLQNENANTGLTQFSRQCSHFLYISSINLQLATSADLYSLI